jgi:type VI secretion system protein VasI
MTLLKFLMPVIFASLLLAASNSKAENLKIAPEDCAQIELNNLRLECYDSNFRPQERVNEPSPSVVQTKWNTRTVISPVDDSTNVFLSLEGDNGIIDRYGRRTEMSITIACRENTTSLYIHFGGHFMSDSFGAGRVTYRVDKRKAQVKSFTESNNHEALGLWNGGTSIPFIKNIFGGEKLYISATPYSESSVSDTFSIAGLESAIAPLRKACNW